MITLKDLQNGNFSFDELINIPGGPSYDEWEQRLYQNPFDANEPPVEALACWALQIEIDYNYTFLEEEILQAYLELYSKKADGDYAEVIFYDPSTNHWQHCIDQDLCEGLRDRILKNREEQPEDNVTIYL